MCSLRNQAIRERSRRTRDHALAARYAGGFAHRLVIIKSDSRGRAFAHPPQNEILANVVAAANAAVAQNARVEIHGNAHRRIVRSAPCGARRIACLSNVFVLGERFQFAITGLPFASAGTDVVGHQEFDERMPRPFHAVGSSVHHHARFHGPNTRRRIYPGAYVHHTNAAHADRALVLLVA